MKIRRVKNIMVPLGEYATVKESDSLHDAVFALKEAQKALKIDDYKHKALLVYDKTGEFIIGKISQLDIIRALEPKYRQACEKDSQAPVGLSRFGLSPDYLKSLSSQYDLWDQPLESLVDKSVSLKVRDFMYTPSGGEFVSEDTALAEAMHQLIIGHHQSLIVMKKDEITGILRLVDIFREVCDLILLKRYNYL